MVAIPECQTESDSALVSSISAVVDNAKRHDVAAALGVGGCFGEGEMPCLVGITHASLMVCVAVVGTLSSAFI